MSERCGQNPLFMGAVEATYGAAVLVIECKSGCKLNYNEIIPPLAIPRNTGQLVTQKMEVGVDTSYVDATMEGVLTVSILNYLLELLTGDAETGASADVWTYVNLCARPGATLFRYTDTGNIVTPETTKYDHVTGALLTQLVINFQPGSPVTFTASFKGKSLDRETTNTGDDALTLGEAVGSSAAHPYDDVAVFGDVTVSLGGTAAITRFNGGTLTLTNELADDSILFQNNSTMVNPVVVRTGGTLAATWQYDTDKDPTINANIRGTMQSDTITLLFGTVHQYAFVTYGQIDSYENPEVDRGKMLGSMVKNIMGDNTDSKVALTVTYTDLTPEE